MSACSNCFVASGNCGNRPQILGNSDAIAALMPCGYVSRLLTKGMCCVWPPAGQLAARLTTAPVCTTHEAPDLLPCGIRRSRCLQTLNCSAATEHRTAKHIQKMQGSLHQQSLRIWYAACAASAAPPSARITHSISVVAQPKRIIIIIMLPIKP
jgi:hypothetical protein